MDSPRGPLERLVRWGRPNHARALPQVSDRGLADMRHTKHTMPNKSAPRRRPFQASAIA
jgi:hypothetical protein